VQQALSVSRQATQQATKLSLDVFWSTALAQAGVKELSTDIVDPKNLLSSVYLIQGERLSYFHKEPCR